MDGLNLAPGSNEEKYIPPVPIKTYKWEDIRRIRTRGGYPWTYLDKEPFNELVDPDIFKMDTSNTKLNIRDEIDIIKEQIHSDEIGNHKNEVKSNEMEHENVEEKETEVIQKDEQLDEQLVKNNNGVIKEENVDEITIDTEIDKNPLISDEPKKFTVTTTELKRAKSEEPGRKRKLSIESGHSRISKYSLSKKGLLKRLKSVKDKIKLPTFFFKPSDPEPKKEEVPVKKIEQAIPKKTVIPESVNNKKKTPVYIHIPLKPPPGQTDEFSYLEFAEEEKTSAKRPSPIKETEIEDVIPESPPETPQTGIQLIILTAPSDDEILDTAPIAETPLPSVNKFFEEKNLDELKTIAKVVVDKYSPETQRKALKEEVIIEEKKSDENDLGKIEPTHKLDKKELKRKKKLKYWEDLQKKKALEEGTIPIQEPKLVSAEVKNTEEITTPQENKSEANITPTDAIEEQHISAPENKNIEDVLKENITSGNVQMTIDEEDGLKTETIIAQIISDEVQLEDKKEEKTKPSPILKKKVSFKRRSKDAEGIYEDIELPGDKEKVVKPPINLSQSMSVDEEKTYLDQKLLKDTSLEDDYNKWSNTNDHEYEPVNPQDSSAEKVELHHHEKKTSTPVSDSDIEFLATRAADYELHKTNLVTVQEPQSGGVIMVPLGSILKSEAIEEKKEPHESHGKKIQDAMKNTATSLRRQASIISEKASTQAEKFQTRVKSIKRPNLKMPHRQPSQEQYPKDDYVPKQTFTQPPKEEIPDRPATPEVPKKMRVSLPKLKIHKPKMPNIPKMKKITMPTFRTTPRRNGHRRQSSTESNVGDSKRKIFDFRTYPRMFSKHKKDSDSDAQTPRSGTDSTPLPERTTLPKFFGSRWKKGKFTETYQSNQSELPDNSVISKESERSHTGDSIRIPLHSEESMDRTSLDLRLKNGEKEESLENNQYSLHQNNIDEEFLKENEAIHRASSLNAKLNERWSHGTFRENLPDDYKVDNNEIITDLDNVTSNKKIGSAQDIRRRGVLEEINPDEFFLRQKGISQDNIEVGQYLSSEIREAFRTPNNTLSHMQDFELNIHDSNLSLPEAPKRRPIKKPKRKKTPHVSNEAITYSQEQLSSAQDRHSFVGDQEDRHSFVGDQGNRHSFAGDQEDPHYQNEYDQNLQYNLNNNEFEAYKENLSFYENEAAQPEKPIRRKKKKSKSSEKDYADDRHLYAGDFPDNYSDEFYENELMQGKEQPGIVVSDPYQEAFFQYDDGPRVPQRKFRSIKSLDRSENDSVSVSELNSSRNISDNKVNTYDLDEGYEKPISAEPPRRPVRLRSRTRSDSRAPSQPEDDLISKRTESIASIDEDICNKSASDYMGYAVINKPKRDPPLPPSAPRRKRSIKSDDKFFTVPRKADTPVRPTRNYSTLNPTRPPRKHSVPNLTDEEKSEVNISQYFEIDDESQGKDLQSGDIIEKMKVRPLPAPPRPPRKTRDSSRGRVSDLTQELNIITDDIHLTHSDIDVSVQTEPLSDGFECEEVTRNDDDIILTPTIEKRALSEFEHEETITHGTLLVQPFTDDSLNDMPTQMISKSTERIITVKKEYVDDERTIDKHEPAQIIERIIERQIPIQFGPTAEFELLKTQTLQVTDIDVDRLAVNELHANTIKVGEIDSSRIQVSEINSNSGNLVVSGIELPASFFQQLVDRLHEHAEKESKQKSDELKCKEEETKTKVDDDLLEPKSDDDDDIGKKKTSFDEDSNELDSNIEMENPPLRPPRTKSENVAQEQDEIMESPELDTFIVTQVCHEQPSEVFLISEDGVRREESEDSAPPRPPQPKPHYEPSQPPASFYMLHSPPIFRDYEIDDDVPIIPKRRRHHKNPIKSYSSSDDIPQVTKRRHRTPEPTIPQLTCQLTRACVNAADRSLKRLIQNILNNFMKNSEDKQDVNVVAIFLIIVIACLILMGWGDGKNVHHHHWEYFNPPRDI